MHEVSKFTYNDFIVIWYGSNDISSNRSAPGVKNILQFVINNLHTNIIVVNVPHRYDLPMSSCVNRKITLFNKKLEKCLKSFNCVNLIKMDCNRKNFTKHGMHLNSQGKLKMSKQIVKCIPIVTNKVVKTPIKLGCKIEYDMNTNDTNVNDAIVRVSTDVSIISEVDTVSNVNKCIRRKPITRNTDFFMGRLRQEITSNRTPACLCRSYKNVNNTHSIGQDEKKNINFNTNTAKSRAMNLYTTINASNLLKVCHQNIRGLVGKTRELYCSLLSDISHIICLTEHHLKEYEINNTLIDNYELGAKYCRIHKNGDVCIYIHNTITFNNILLEKYCVEKDTEVCAVKLTFTNIKIMVLTIYR
jgi:hypothetical protein